MKADPARESAAVPVLTAARIRRSLTVRLATAAVVFIVSIAPVCSLSREDREKREGDAVNGK